MICADHVEGDEGEPVDGVDAVGEQNEPCLVEPTRTFPGFEGIQRCGNDQEEWKEQTYKTCVNTYISFLVSQTYLCFSVINYYQNKPES